MPSSIHKFSTSAHSEIGIYDLSESQILGHSDLMTTNTYLDSFTTNIIDEAAKVL